MGGAAVALAVANTCRTLQRSVCRGAWQLQATSRPVPDVWPARLRDDDRRCGVHRMHMHASTYDRPDSWSTACFVLDQLAVTDGCVMAFSDPREGQLSVDRILTR